MNKIKLRLEYQCFPVWIYNENDDLMANDLPEILLNDIEIDTKCVELQKIFDNLYLDNHIEFSYIGFNDEDKKMKFINNVKSIKIMLNEKIGSDYEIINNINIENL